MTLLRQSWQIVSAYTVTLQSQSSSFFSKDILNKMTPNCGDFTDCTIIIVFVHTYIHLVTSTMPIFSLIYRDVVTGNGFKADAFLLYIFDMSISPQHRLHYNTPLSALFWISVPWFGNLCLRIPAATIVYAICCIFMAIPCMKIIFTIPVFKPGFENENQIIWGTRAEQLSVAFH